MGSDEIGTRWRHYWGEGYCGERVLGRGAGAKLVSWVRISLWRRYPCTSSVMVMRRIQVYYNILGGEIKQLTMMGKSGGSGGIIRE